MLVNNYIGIGSQASKEEIEALEKTGLYYAEEKKDGIFCSIVNNEVHSRTNTIKKVSLPPLEEGVILLGELGYGTESSCRRREKLGIDWVDVFDIIMLNGAYLNKSNFERRLILEAFIKSLPEAHKRHYILVEKRERGFLPFFNEVEEGIVLKEKEATLPALGVKTKQWIKVKKVWTVDVFVSGFRLSKSKKYKGLVESFQMSVKRNGETVEVASIGSLSEHVKQEALNFDLYEGRVAELECYSIFKSGALRHASLVRWRKDKTKDDCLWSDVMKTRDAIVKAGDCQAESLKGGFSWVKLK